MDDVTCCGRIAEWKGGPIRPGCGVCPNSPTWWRRQPDGSVRADRSAAESYENTPWGERR